MSAKRSFPWLQGLGCGVLVATAAPLALVLTVTLVPAGLCAAAGAGALARIMLVYAAAVLALWTGDLWHLAQSWPAALNILGQWRLPAMAWAAQGAAWLLTQATPLLARAVLEARVRGRMAHLRDARARLAADWGLEG